MIKRPKTNNSLIYNYQSYKLTLQNSKMFLASHHAAFAAAPAFAALPAFGLAAPAIGLAAHHIPVAAAAYPAFGLGFDLYGFGAIGLAHHHAALLI